MAPLLLWDPGSLSESLPHTGFPTDLSDWSPAQQEWNQSQNTKHALHHTEEKTFPGNNSGERMDRRPFSDFSSFSQLQFYPKANSLILSRILIFYSNLPWLSILSLRHFHQRTLGVWKDSALSTFSEVRMYGEIGCGLGSQALQWAHPKVPNSRPGEQTGACQRHPAIHKSHLLYPADQMERETQWNPPVAGFFYFNHCPWPRVKEIPSRA